MTESFEIIPAPEEPVPIDPPVKWLRYLFYIHIANIAMTPVTLIFLDNPITPWIGYAMSAGIALCLFRLAPACHRYRTAAILTAVHIGLTILSMLVWEVPAFPVFRVRSAPRISCRRSTRAVISQGLSIK